MDGLDSVKPNSEWEGTNPWPAVLFVEIFIKVLLSLPSALLSWASVLEYTPCQGFKVEY